MARRGEPKDLHLYRPVATSDSDAFKAGQRVSDLRGYLSRSGAVKAGEASGVDFEIEVSHPVTFPSERDRKFDRLVGQLVVAVLDDLPDETTKALAREIDERREWE